PAAWRTLAREFGIRFGVVWRGLGGEPGQERDLYRWRGPEGRDVLLWHLLPRGYELGAALPADADGLGAVWTGVRTALVERAAGKHVAVLIGADHHAAHPAVSRLRELLAELEPRSAFRVSRLDEFLQLAGEGAKPAPLDGELRWSYRYAWTLQGVHATRAPLKRRATAAELSLERLAEPLAALARRAGARRRRGAGARAVEPRGAAARWCGRGRCHAVSARRAGGAAVRRGVAPGAGVPAVRACGAGRSTDRAAAARPAAGARAARRGPTLPGPGRSGMGARGAASAGRAWLGGPVRRADAGRDSAGPGGRGRRGEGPLAGEP